ncbi:HXXXD-type acyl-transferase family protein [Forsythia ovata]|uniref:HXXXD-type acyl-transferase family protein n=1 Tax=Forsythia ovata TaxID=205694 RepID=A0ABD1RPN8_9LAMI
MASNASLGSALHIDAMQSVVPMNPTDPRESTRVLVSGSHSSTIFGRCFHIVLCYNKTSDEDCGWLVAGWIKESLGRALSGQPLLAGRLRRHDDKGDEDLQIVSNDSGVRLVEARIDINLSDFLDLKAKKDAETTLVYWEDIHEQNPQFFPLFYVQVTNFKCGGYSIGISSSLLLEDPFVITSFLKKWANVHKSLVSKSDVPKMPIFYLPNHRNSAGGSPSLLMGSKTSKSVAQSVVFKIPTKISNLDSHIYYNLAAQCIDEAEHVVGTKMASKFSLFVKKPDEDIKVEICSKEGLIQKPYSSMSGFTCASSWDLLEVDEICFNEGNKAAYVSCWINSIFDEGSVMIVGSDNEDTSGTKIIVTLTAKK